MWAQGLFAVTLFVEDLAGAKAFYQDVFELPIVFEDDTSVAFRLGATLINLLVTTSAPELIAPATVATPEAGARMQFTIQAAGRARCDTLEWSARSPVGCANCRLQRSRRAYLGTRAVVIVQTSPQLWRLR